MLSKNDLQAIGELILASEKRLRADLASKDDLKDGLNATEKRLRADLASKDDLKDGLNATEKRLKKAIADSQEDTVVAVQGYIDTGYTMLDERIEKIEDALDLLHPGKN